ncbi:MAG: class I SAM-dependent methyltransferase [Proteobacteria bacterium]|nr:class I SAM-dependent methyltransferase [Pseudomonadota bacterium]
MQNDLGKNPFRSSASYYARYRPAYGDDLISHIVALCKTSPEITYDLGCGTGELAIPLSRIVKNVYAIDREATMLVEAQRKASENGITNITFIEGSAENVPLELPAPQLVTLGQCFHWMDREKVLRYLCSRMSSGGVVVIISGDPLGTVFRDMTALTCPNWIRVLSTLFEKWCGTPQQLPQQNYLSHKSVAASLKEWAIEEQFYAEKYVRSVEEVIGLCLSFSWCSPEKLGDQLPLFEKDVRTQLLAVQPDGIFVEETGRDILILRRK